MAEGNRDGDESLSPRPKSPRTLREASDDESDILKPDLGLGEQPSFERRPETSADLPKREENPFSFKHFLRRETSSSSTGARRKVYPSSPSSSCYVPEPDIYAPELASALPDFVQDHLVVEQCFGHQEQLPDFAQRLEQLPDFALSSGDHAGLEQCFALGNQQLPDFTRSDALPDFTPRSDALPDFTPRSDALPDFTPRTERPEETPADTEMVGALPDFLLHRSEPPTEIEMLRRELDSTRRALAAQASRTTALEQELRGLRAAQRRELAALQKAMEAAEDNLKRSTRRAVTAENMVSNLKQEIKSLTSEASGGTARPSPSTARDLRRAASTAESALRTLLAGVSELRGIADSIDRADDDGARTPR